MNVFRFLSELAAYQNKYVGMLALLYKGVYIAGSHSLSLLDFREIHLKKARFSSTGGERE